ncbi:hypothetical protein GCM10007989_24510 [Devosia pacifica]|uniref:SH3b domain-containing protein n=1 Tax=Devosia pacifica TaxID=1335967 RepID=A0A918VVU4_9HYPH|nr:SH3 domain-containing protein [Devosia pacifica]GHA27724.1 hypothetical protein GCM10007989_24510 [Devosia pacifica]
MIIILPIIVLMIALSVLIAFGALALAMGAAALAANSAGESHNSRRIKALMLVGGALSFGLIWYALGPIDQEEFLSGIDYLLKAAVAMMAAALVMGVAGIFLRVSIYLVKRRSVGGHVSVTSMLGLAGAGLAIGGLAVLSIGSSIGAFNYSLQARTLPDTHPGYSRQNPDSPQRHHYDAAQRPSAMPSETHYSKGDLTDVHSAPEQSSRVVTTLSQGDCVAVVGSANDDFYEIRIWEGQAVRSGFVGKFDIRKLRSNQGCSRR